VPRLEVLFVFNAPDEDEALVHFSVMFEAENLAMPFFFPCLQRLSQNQP
jgi:hypothetical protein